MNSENVNSTNSTTQKLRLTMMRTKYESNSSRHNSYCICFVVLAAIVLLIGVVLIIKYASQSSDEAETRASLLPSQLDEHGWVDRYSNLGSECVVRLMDLNNDGSDDILIGVAEPTHLVSPVIEQADYCKEYPDGCKGAVMAINGRNGKLIWSFPTYSEVFELNCGNMDIDGDGIMDCLGAGRKGTYIAFNKMGKLLWKPQNGKQDFIEHSWNIYNPLIIQDANSDGISDVVLAHGGDPDFPPENKSRYAGRLILLDGRTGEKLGKFINLPDGRETYNSPVLHTDSKGSRYILIGTGGETVSGGLFMIEESDFINAVFGRSGRSKPNHRLPKYDNLGFYRIFRSTYKGVMVPVVLVDVNSDKTDDIIMTSFDGILAAFDGNSFQQIWKHADMLAESYTTPGIGYFDDDNYIDIVMHWNYGIWPQYNRSTVVVHSGLDGSIIWAHNNSAFSMTSALTLTSLAGHEDKFVMRTLGTNSNQSDLSSEVLHGVDSQRLDIGYYSKKSDCNSKVRQSASVYVVNPQKKNEGLTLLYSQSPEPYHYEEAGLALCVMMEQVSRTTGALGDTNGDGKIDLVLTFNGQANLKDKKGSYLRTEVNFSIVVLELEKRYFTVTADSTRWGNIQTQKWTGYMGANSLSKYS